MAFSPSGENRLQWDFGHNNKEKNREEKKKILIYEQLGNNFLLCSNVIREKVVYVQIRKECPETSLLCLITP